MCVSRGASQSIWKVNFNRILPPIEYSEGNALLGRITLLKGYRELDLIRRESGTDWIESDGVRITRIRYANHDVPGMSDDFMNFYKRERRAEI